MATTKYRYNERERRRKAEGRPEPVPPRTFERVKKEILRDYARTFDLLASHDRGDVVLPRVD